MKLLARSVALLLPFTLTACIHFGHTQQVQPLPPAIEANPKASQLVLEETVLDTTILAEPITPATMQKLTPKPKPSAAKRVSQATSNIGQAPNSTASSSGNTLVAANMSPAASVIGPLSSGESSDLRKQTVDLLTVVERGLNGIVHKLSDSEQKTAAQIREYLKQARGALTTGDVDGAHTLGAKARLLLSELNN